MTQRLLTIGMPTWDDYDGVFFSLQSLRMHHPQVQDCIEFVLIDNNPGSPHGECNKRLLESVPNGRYFAEKEWQGPWVKDLVMRKANTPYALCMDSHVLLPTGVLEKLVNFYNDLESGDEISVHGDRQPAKSDLFQGPLIYDNLATVSTHFAPGWRGQMYGKWSTDERGQSKDADPFQIPAQGMGLFTCHVDAWAAVGGFNRLMRGFGGEEYYIHTKFDQAGHKTWCLPFLRWHHRFNRPAGVRYALTWEAKVRNYFICYLETNQTPDACIDHFIKVNQYVTEPAIRALWEQTKKEFAAAARGVVTTPAAEEASPAKPNRPWIPEVPKG